LDGKYEKVIVFAFITRFDFVSVMSSLLETWY